MFIGSENDGGARFHHATQQFLDVSLCGVRGRPAKLLFEDLPLELLSGSHRAAAAQLRIIEPVDEVGCPDQEIDVHRPVLTVLKGSEPVENQRLVRCLFGAHLFVKEETVPPQAVGQVSDSRMRDAGLSRDLTQSGARDESVEDRLEEVAAAQPVVGGEGL